MGAPARCHPHAPAAGRAAARRWPNLLAQRLAAAHALDRLAVIDEGISGNRVLPDREGQDALARFDRIGVEPNIPGSGLGLSLVAAVARLHRATLELGDNQPGLRVTIDFPRVTDRAQAAA